MLEKARISAESVIIRQIRHKIGKTIGQHTHTYFCLGVHGFGIWGYKLKFEGTTFESQ